MAINRKIWTASLLLVISSPGFAGEITGNGKITPIESGGVASSICAYSGRNDTPGLDGFGEVQAYGMLVKAFGGFDPGFSHHPGVACRG
ncbi:MULTISPECIES: hypothetical protein [Qipengyuania]|uniref:Uncharacterized protein n=1 Tax=Qipengyuania soli TaxID=2782568 RepID=A0A7S8ITL0_9SPHN|nr:hypothetical protein [Qipengyuania soli]QPC97924.1 hypothetical protein IRL76_08430 [Qipengyuania soli]